MRRDYKVDFRREETIADEAWARRVRAKNELFGYFNVADFIERDLPLDPKVGRIRVVHDVVSDDLPAFVTYRPITLHVDEEIWELMKQGEPKSRYIGAHECGHLVLHDYRAQAFSDDEALRIKYVPDEYSAEWQANIFADHLLLPNRLVISINDATELVKYAVTRELAERRLQAVRTKPPLQIRSPGDPCPECGTFLIAKSGFDLWCRTCGKSVVRFGFT